MPCVAPLPSRAHQLLVLSQYRHLLCVQSTHSGHLQKPEHRCVHTSEGTGKQSMLCLTNPQEQIGELQQPSVLRPQPACLSTQAVATSSTLSVRAPCSTGTDISGTDLSTAGAADWCTGEPGHRPTTPSGRCSRRLHPGHHHTGSSATSLGVGVGRTNVH